VTKRKQLTCREMTWHLLAFVLVMLIPACQKPPVVVAPSCQRNDLRVQDMDADFREIWQGLESVETGKRADIKPEVTLTFNMPVVARAIAASIHGGEVVGADGGTPGASGEGVVELEAVSHDDARPTVTLRTNRALRFGFRYTFRVEVNSMTPDGACLAEPIAVVFLTAAKRESRFDREVGERRFKALISFTAKEGIRTPVARVFDRYRERLRLRSGVDDLRPDGDAYVDPFGTRATSGELLQSFRQTYKGVPVYSRGFTVVSRDGIFVSAYSGKIEPNLDLRVQPEIEKDEAEDIARGTKAYISGAEAETELQILMEKSVPTLAWQVMWGSPQTRTSLDRNRSGRQAVINANTGDVIYADDGIRFSH
jgi:Fungalysin/Thermolysin Propeptide Motif